MKTKIEKAFISFRIGVQLWMSEDRFNALLDLFDKYRGVTDEITLFTSETHPPLNLDVVESRAAVLRERMHYARKKGYSSGINILSTIGHHNENLPGSLSEDYTHMTDIDGNVCLGSFCPNDENMRSYIKSLYEIIASAEPDYIWIDDDIRLLGHMPVTYSCFCDNCLAIFEKEFGGKYSRESLRKVFNDGSAESKLQIRKAWLQHNRNTVSKLFELVEKAVHDLKPDMPLGFMTGERFFEGYDFEKWAGILSGSGNAEVMWRPGGGFYSDERMKELAGKSHEIGRQVSLLPENILSIQSEIENFPYQVLKKSAGATSLEAASHMAAGCTGAAFNILPFGNEPFTEYEALISKLRKTRPFYDLLANTFGRHKPSGIYTGWVKDSFAANNIGWGDWLLGYIGEFTGNHANEIFEIGLPVSYSPANAKVTAASGDSILAMDGGQIKSILSSGVYMDAKALINLNKLGYRELTGFEVQDFVSDDCIEEYIEHYLNKGIAGQRRDGRQSFYNCPAGVLIPCDKDAQVLGKLVNYMDKEVASCSMGVFENKLGGRICVSGYYPWTFLQNLSKSTQIKAVMRWLSKDTLPAYVDSLHKINMWVRELDDGITALALINSCLDAAENLTMMIRTDKEEISIFDMQLSETRAASCGSDGVYRKFIIPEIGAWDMCLIITR